jgi:regulator of RNase E activity RraA
LKSFDDLPLLDVKTKMDSPKKNNITDISFPIEFANQNICFLIGDEIAYFTADSRGIVTIKAKDIVKTIDKR